MAARASLKRNRKANGRKASPSNGLGGAPDEVWLRWMKKIATAQSAVARAQKPLKQRRSELSQIYKQAKADGVNVAMVRSALKDNDRDHIEVAIDFRDKARALHLLESPLTEQLHLFSIEVIPSIVNVAMQGKQAGLAGADINECPYKPGSEEFVAYRENWERGQAEVRQTLHN